MRENMGIFLSLHELTQAPPSGLSGSLSMGFGAREILHRDCSSLELGLPSFPRPVGSARPSSQQSPFG